MQMSGFGHMLFLSPSSIIIIIKLLCVAPSGKSNVCYWEPKELDSFGSLFLKYFMLTVKKLEIQKLNA